MNGTRVALALWSAIFAGALGVVYAGFALGVSGEVAVVAVTVAVGFLLMLLERVCPEQPAWHQADGQWWHDLGHLVLNYGTGTFLGTWGAQALFATPLWNVWPDTWPMLIQAVLGLIVAEFSIYWQHRIVHRTPSLWPLHALHHSTERMTFFKTTRIHALDIGSSTFLSLASLLALGAPMPVLLWVIAFGNFAGQTQHANVWFRTPRWMNALIGTPAVHWLHHSTDLRAGNSNFGMNVMLWDHVFGTYLPPEAEPETSLGLTEDPVPRTFVGQLTLPWAMVRAFARRTDR
jgi:ornithine lipid hydroxylase